MALETFLINRPQKRKSSTRKKRRGGGLPSGLLSRMIRTHGIKKGMKEAWKAHRSGVRNPRPKLPASYHRKTAKHRPVVYSGVRKGSYVRSPYSRSPQINPFGEEVMIVGNKPRKRKRVVRHRRKKSYLRNPSPKRRLYARKRHVSHRRRRSNPARSGVPAISYRRPMSLIMPAASVAGGIFAADYLPAMIGMAGSPLTRLGVKLAVGFAGAMILKGKNGALFAAGAGANALMDVVKTYVFKTGATAGFGAFTRPQLGAFTRPSTPFQGVQRFPS